MSLTLSHRLPTTDRGLGGSLILPAHAYPEAMTAERPGILSLSLQQPLPARCGAATTEEITGRKSLLGWLPFPKRTITPVW